MARCVLCMVVLAVSIVSGCAKKIDRSMLVGIYVANHGNAIETLELKSDGTYIYNYRSSDGTAMTNSNRWEFAYEEGEPRITFDEFIFGLPGYGTKVPVSWDVGVERRWNFLNHGYLNNCIRICTNPDLNYYYEKPLP